MITHSLLITHYSFPVPTFFSSFLPYFTALMREGLFIKKNKDRWERLEHQVPVNPDEMAKDFTKLVDDLAYAKTFYPTSRVTRYINSLAANKIRNHLQIQTSLSAFDFLEVLLKDYNYLSAN